MNPENFTIDNPVYREHFWNGAVTMETIAQNIPIPLSDKPNDGFVFTIIGQCPADYAAMYDVLLQMLEHIREKVQQMPAKGEIVTHRYMEDDGQTNENHRIAFCLRGITTTRS